MELRHLRYFVAVAEELNFGRAARRLHMAQPPLSVAIRQLEQELGTNLFARTSREVRLTEAGEAFLVGARRTLAEADAAVAATKRVAAGELGVVRVGYNWSAGFDTLPALGRELARVRPDIDLATEEMRPRVMAAALQSGTIDVAVALWPDVVAELSYLPVRRERIVAVLSVDHPLAHEHAVGLEALADDFLVFPREIAPRLHDFYVGLCRAAGFEPKQSRDSARSRWMLGTWDLATVALLPQSVSTHLPHGAVAVGIEAPAHELETQLVWRTDDPSTALAVFRDAAHTAFRSGEAASGVAAAASGEPATTATPGG